MVSGIGVDIESIKRFKKSCSNKRFLNLIFTDLEIKYCKNKSNPYINFAGKFCAKEAVIKASKKGISMRDIEILNSESGKIRVLVNGKYKKNMHISISHTKEYAVAFAVID